MSEKIEWNWEISKKQIAHISKSETEIQWREESQVSPDGEKIAAIVNIDAMDFGICVNNEILEEHYERAWKLHFAPNGQLICLVTLDEEPTISIDGEAIEERFGFVWQPMFAKGTLAAAIQNDMEYGMYHNGKIWDNLFINANNFVLSKSGKTTAACIQTEEFGQADIQKFQSGLFSVAVNGTPWKSKFVNTWTPAVSNNDELVAVQIRKDLYRYSIAVNDRAWHQDFSMIWEPIFHPKTNDVYAPVRINGKWGIARNGHLADSWQPSFSQLWHCKFNADGSILAAIGSPSYGKWTVVINGKPWHSQASYMVTDLTMSEDGSTITVLTKNELNRWSVMVNDKAWSTSCEMAYPPIISDNGEYVAVKMERNGRQTIVVNDKPYSEDFRQVWEPVFSPENNKILIKALNDNGEYIRIVEPLSLFTK